MIITAMLLFKGLNKVELNLSALENTLVIFMLAAVVWMTIYILARGMRRESLDRSTFLLFSWMQVFTAAGFAFSHGSNDIANAIGPFAAVLDVLSTGEINSKAPVPPAAMLSFGIAMVVGLWFIGKEVIQTVGTALTRMHPSSGFTAELSAASVVLVASTLGIPVSSTHILVGAVLGIGVVNRATNWQLMKPIGMAWVITLPSSALLSAITLIALRSWL
jgi:PiT family inorganic phosphate transporter